MASSENSSQKDALTELGKILKKDSANITVALHLFGAKIRVHNPTKQEKINIHRALTMFSEYWRLHSDNINNINYLSSFATVFVDEILFNNEYVHVCEAIKHVMKRDQMIGINENWRSADYL
jgi:thymidine kinase